MPDIPSAGLRIALHDLILCEKHPDYMVYMSSWHNPSTANNRIVCEVCLGGSVLARIENNPFKPIDSPAESCVSFAEKIMAMEYFRNGRILSGVKVYLGDERFGKLHNDTAEKIISIEGQYGVDVYSPSGWVTYQRSAKQFKNNLFLIADKLEAMGL